MRRRIGDYDGDTTGLSIQHRQQAKAYMDMAKDETEIPADAVAEVA